jgi:hypothetical protein
MGACGRRVAAAMALVLSAGPPAAAQDDGGDVTVQIENRAWGRVEVTVYDLVCRQAIYDGEILDDASVAVEACAADDGLARIEVVDRDGRRQAFAGLVDQSTVTLDSP